ncbi:MAG TPA: BON domain-containing protein [Pyrinomonadaceae bacterium]|jgi:BON domain-containing protein|nr:BON domain-containing protein [Pyrinomonadaceae bacterium]
MEQRNRRRVVVTTSGEHVRRVSPRGSVRKPGPREWVLALVLIGAAALATFFALFLTSRPYDPMNSTVQPQQSVPQGQLQLQSTPTPSPSTSPTAKPTASAAESTVEPAQPPPDDATVQQEIEQALHSDSALADLDISTIVEGGRVTIVGSVRSVELKQRVVRVVRGIKGVGSIDNQLVVIEATP